MRTGGGTDNLKKFLQIAILMLAPAFARAQFINSVVASPQPNTLTISWLTSSPAKAYVKYGLSPTSLTLRYPTTGAVTTGTVTISGLSSSTTYYFRIYATDGLKQPATSIVYSTLTLAHSVDLNWSETQAGVTFNVYRDPGTGMTLLQSGVAAMKYTDSAVALGATYTYEVTAVDASGNESAPSNSAVATIPAT